jgi:lysophospholipase L1-like esterase
MAIGIVLPALQAQVAGGKTGKKWELEIRAFEAADKLAPPPENAILFVGSSGIRKWTTLQQDFPEYKVINRGFGGSAISDSVYYADRIVIPYKPRIIVFRAGNNDIAEGKTPETVAADFRAFVEKVRAKLPDVKIIFVSLNPTPARWANADKEWKTNRLIQEYIAAGKNLDYVDTFSHMLGADGRPRAELYAKDRMHNSPAGYQLWTSLIKPHLK